MSRGRGATPRATPRHGGAVRPRGSAGALRARHFGVSALAVATVLGLGAGAGTAVALDRLLAGDAVGVQAASAAVVEGGPDRAADPTPRAAVEPTPTPTPTPSAPSSEPEPTPDPLAVDAQGLTAADRAAGLLSTVVPQAASGELAVVPGQEAAPRDAAQVLQVRVEVEGGLDVDPAAFASVVMSTLNDPRGWGADGSVVFARTDGDADLRVVLASPDKVDAMCAPLDTGGLYSCGRYGHAALNYRRWVEATPEFADRTQYRQYLVNHEVGHLLGHPHVSCPGEGSLAPLMQQQSIKVAPCVPNGWPFP